MKMMKNQSPNTSESEKSSFMEDSIIFEDLYLSAFSKACSISTQVTNVTLGPNSIGLYTREPSITSREYNSPSDQDIFAAAHTICLPCSTPKLSNSRKSITTEKTTKDRILQEKVDKLAERLPCTTKISKSVSAKKLLLDLQADGRLTVEMVMRERMQNVYKADRLVRASLDRLKQTIHEAAITKRIIAEQKILDDVEEQVIKNRTRREEQAAQDLLKNAQRVHERNQKVKDAEEEARKKSEAIAKRREQLSEILESQKNFGKEYRSMLETIKTCRDKTALAELVAMQPKELKSSGTGFENLVKKCKSGEITAEDIAYAESLVEVVKDTHARFKAEIDRINDALEAEAKIAEEMKTDAEQVQLAQQQQERQQQRQQEEATTTEPNDLSDCFDPVSMQRYIDLKTFAESFEHELEPLLMDESVKKMRFSWQKAVTIPVNAISPVNGHHLADKYLKLHNLLLGQRVEAGDTLVCAAQHPLGVPFCKNLLAKKFVRQGDLAVSSKPDAAFSIAAVMVALWVEFPDFGQLVLAHFQRECPYLAPVFLPQVEGQTDEDYYKSLGYNFTKPGEVEKQDSFLKRMSGIMRLYAALLVTKVRQPGKGNPLGVTEAWRWLAAILNLPPQPDICATLLFDFLEVAGHSMFAAYGAQFKKLLAYICQEYFPKLEKVTPPTAMGPIVRLEEFLQKVLKVGTISPPEGLLPTNFW